MGSTGTGRQRSSTYVQEARKWEAWPDVTKKAQGRQKPALENDGAGCEISGLSGQARVPGGYLEGKVLLVLQWAGYQVPTCSAWRPAAVVAAAAGIGGCWPGGGIFILFWFSLPTGRSGSRQLYSSRYAALPVDTVIPGQDRYCECKRYLDRYICRGSSTLSRGAQHVGSIITVGVQVRLRHDQLVAVGVRERRWKIRIIIIAG